MLSRRSLFAAAAALLLAVTAARPATAAPDPKVFVESLAQSALDAMVSKGLSDADRVSKFRVLFVEGVDLPEIGRFVLGRYWRTATPEQQQEFLALFEDMMVYTWAPRFKDYAEGLSHEVVAVIDEGDKGIRVESKVKREKQPPIALFWQLDGKSGALKVQDLIVEGSSMRITYRSEYGAVVQGNGGKIDGLLDVMRKKLSEMKAQVQSAKAN